MSDQGCATCKYEFEDAHKYPCVECCRANVTIDRSSKWKVESNDSASKSPCTNCANAGKPDDPCLDCSPSNGMKYFTSQVSVGGQVLNNMAQLSALGKQSTTFESRLDAELADLRAFLMSKNQAYGDSALNPVRVFSKSNSTEQLRVRIDDKISRLMRGAACGEDTVKDLTCYLILLRIAERKEQNLASPSMNVIGPNGQEEFVSAVETAVKNALSMVAGTKLCIKCGSLHESYWARCPKCEITCGTNEDV